LTASALGDDRERVLSTGCDDFVSKPFREEKIFDMLVKHLGVRFVCEELDPTSPPKPLGYPTPQEADTQLTGRLAALPFEWVTRLQQAARLGDLGQIAELIHLIGAQDADLAEALETLAHEFEHEKILTLIRQAREEP
jgi:CheY-like chemotaxis protein